MKKVMKLMNLKMSPKEWIINCVVLGIEILLICNCIIAFFRPLSEYKFEGEELLASNAIFLEQFLGEDRNGYYIDDSLVSEEDKIEDYWIGTPKVDLGEGSHEVKISYKTGTNGNTYTTSSVSNFYQTKMGRQNIGLDPKKEECLFSLEYDLDIEGYAVTVNYSGDNYIFVDEISIRETHYFKIKNLVVTLSIILLINFLWIRRKSKVFNKKSLTVIVCSIAGIGLASIPAFASYLYDGHDLLFHLTRIEGIADSLSAGIFPARMHFSSLNGAGYPVSIFYGDLFLYIPALMRVLGWSVQTAYQSFIVFINAMSWIIMYSVIKSIFKDEWLGIYGAFIYLMAPYRLLNIYTRAAVGEYTAMCFLPLIVYGLYRIFTDEKEKDKYDWIYLALGFSGVIFSHVISTFIVFVLTALFCMVNIKKVLKKDILIKMVNAVLLTLGITAWFIGPFIDYMLSGIISKEVEFCGVFEGRALTLEQLLYFYSLGQYIGSVPKHEEILYGVERSCAIGVAFALSLVLFIIFYINSEQKKRKLEKLGENTFIFSLLTLWMTTVYFPWNQMEQIGGDIAVYLMSNIQFPWRFLGSASALLVFVAVVVIELIKQQNGKNMCYSVMMVLGVLSLISGNFYMTEYMNQTPKVYATDEGDVQCSIGLGEYLPEGAGGYLSEILHDANVQIHSGGREQEIYRIECTNLTNEEQYIQIPVICYKYYCAKDVKTEAILPIERGDAWRIKIILPENYHGTIAVEFTSPWYWRVSEFISWVVIGSMVVVIFGKYFKQNKQKKSGLKNNA